MTFRSLANIPAQEVVQCFLEAFKDYYVKFNAAPQYFINRWKAAKVDFDLSFGAFIDERLVGFVLMGIDDWNGYKTAYNAGTGVIPQFRGKRIVQKLYDHFIPLLKAQGIEQSILEVITVNEIAIRAYNAIGYEIERELFCFSGTCKQKTTRKILKEPFHTGISIGAQPQAYSWENTTEHLLMTPQLYECWTTVDDSGGIIGKALIQPNTGYIAQYEFQSVENGIELMQSIASHCNILKINNVDEHHQMALEVFRSSGLQDIIQQYEMKLVLS
ncbi:hypothetical protein COR50_14660 [Chitinophaga caeni]|uniref:N-acetyltransferase domain-containing protein n=1 Tax=Chitinophaga caeni TaxID=2029983 RepID=A0A291QWG4_9BACT|nr:GNAT family N-acetyltransferase [Chitinophaga caeni]ATL48306.1 hypothetical protein COR50_14660 [Chitinophaga caeni]